MTRRRAAARLKDATATWEGAFGVATGELWLKIEEDLDLQIAPG